MATYTIAQAKDQLSKLVDEVLTGAPVTITRHGKPVVQMLPAQRTPRPMTDRDLEELAAFRKSLPKPPQSAVDLIRKMRDEDRS